MAQEAAMVFLYLFGPMKGVRNGESDTRLHKMNALRSELYRIRINGNPRDYPVYPSEKMGNQISRQGRIEPGPQSARTRCIVSLMT